MTGYPYILLQWARFERAQWLLFAIAFVAVALLWWRGHRDLPGWAWRQLDWWSAKAWRTMLLVFAIGFGASALAGSRHWTPQPSIHDEFGYLLIADTLLSGRLANPTPPAWESFQVVHTLMVPAYVSKFPPGPGALLALCLLLTGGSLAAAAWMKASLACAVFAWMLRGVAPARWALLGGILGLFPFAVFSPWAQTFWGGSAAFLGGSLAFGAAARLARTEPRLDLAAVLGAGLFVLAFTRPFEGAAAMAPVGIWMLWRGRQWIAGGIARGRVLALYAVLAAWVAAVAGAWGVYNHAGTGNPLRMAYMEYRHQYAVVPEMLGGEAREPLRTTPRFEALNENQMRYHARDSGMPWIERRRRPANSFRFFFPALLVAPAFAGLWALSARPGGRMMMGGLAACALAGGLTWGSNAHYYAPAGALAGASWTLGLRLFWGLRGRWRVPGRAYVAAAVAAIIASHAIGMHRYYRNPHRSDVHGNRRARLVRQIEAVPGQHLVFVAFPRNTAIHADWTFNRADIPGARIVWAATLDPDQNRAVVEAFPGRTLWVLDGDRGRWLATPEDGDAMLFVERGPEALDPP